MVLIHEKPCVFWTHFSYRAFSGEQRPGADAERVQQTGFYYVFPVKPFVFEYVNKTYSGFFAHFGFSQMIFSVFFPDAVPVQAVEFNGQFFPWHVYVKLQRRYDVADVLQHFVRGIRLYEIGEFMFFARRTPKGRIAFWTSAVPAAVVDRTKRVPAFPASELQLFVSAAIKVFIKRENGLIEFAVFDVFFI